LGLFPEVLDFNQYFCRGEQNFTLVQNRKSNFDSRKNDSNYNLANLFAIGKQNASIVIN